MNLARISSIALPLFALALAAPEATAQPLAKGAVAEKIRRVEDGVDEFRNYLERRGENARETSSNAQAAGSSKTRTSRRGGSSTSTANTETRKAAANEGKDELKDALDDLNRSTNRLRRKFDATDNWMETKVQVEAVVDDGRKINQAITRGNYGSEAARLWAALRNAINDLARAYNVAPLGA